MKTCILMGSPRKNGNTEAILQVFARELVAHGAEAKTFWLYDKDIAPCTACRCCQKTWTEFGCRHMDDMHAIFDAILASELLILATPIYSWYCTPPMKALLDRLVYGMNKYYGEAKGPSLWAGKSVALVVTCGYRPEKGADLFEEGIKRYCNHSGLRYIGIHAGRDLGYSTVFMSEEKATQARAFAKTVWNACHTD